MTLSFNEENLYFEKIIVSPMLGADIGQAIRNALRLSAKYRCGVEFDFNGSTVLVDSTATVDAIYHTWQDSLGAPE